MAKSITKKSIAGETAKRLIEAGEAAARELGVPMVIGSAVRQMLSITYNLYGPESDVTDTARLLERWAGLDLPDASKPK